MFFLSAAIFCCIFFVGCGKQWTVETARREAFKNVQYKIDPSKYASQDPDFLENQEAIKRGQERVEDRYVTQNPEPPIGYVVSRLNKKGKPTITMFYAGDGRLMSMRLFSDLDYPRTAYIYCIEDHLTSGKRVYRSGELMSVSFRPSKHEEFYFTPEQEFSGRVTF